MPWSTHPRPPETSGIAEMLRGSRPVNLGETCKMFDEMAMVGQTDYVAQWFPTATEAGLAFHAEEQPRRTSQ